MKEVLWVGLGGFLGANARYLLGGWIMARLSPGFPYATFAINVSGSFILGLIMGTLEGRTLSPVVSLAAGAGFVGAYTTFSTWTYETIKLIENGSLLLATANVFGSIVIGIAAVAAGLAVGRAL